MYIFRAGTWQGGMIGVNLPFEFCWQKNCSQLLKSRLFHSQPYLGKFSGCWFFLHYNSWCQPMNFLAKTWSLDFLSKSSSSRMPHNFLYGFATQPTENNQFTPLPLFKGCLTQVCIFSAETLQGNMLGVKLALSSASKKSALILWKQECVILKPA